MGATVEWRQDGRDEILVARTRRYRSKGVEILRVRVPSGDSGKPDVPKIRMAGGPLFCNITVAGLAANAHDITVQVVDQLGLAVTGKKKVRVDIVATTIANGDISDAGTQKGVRDVTFNTGPNVCYGTTDSSGKFTFKVTDAVAELVGCTVSVANGLPNHIELQF